MNNQGCTPVEIPSLLGFRDCDFVVRCLELLLRNIPTFAPESETWEFKVIALCHHHPANIYPALGVLDCAGADLVAIDKFGKSADEWVRSRPLGWLIDASKDIPALSRKDLSVDT
ncbi:hypothetical protein [Haloferula sp. BvORR071]|uniref:hypothetical protein n=1 Tax=Haloferula sp. BvORR071 TaxID=1396141 RepID=UPI0005573B99|nr:hypothetical protein [Haloferula sp. BvORR071]